MTPIPPDLSPTAEELRAAVHGLVDSVVQVARAEHGSVPGVGTAAWWTAPMSARLAGLLVIAEAWLTHDPQLAIAERFRTMSIDLSQSYDWTAAAHRPSHAELQRRRSEAAA